MRMTPLPPPLLFALEAAQERLHGISALLDALGTSQSPAHAAKVREWASRSRQQLQTSIETAIAHYQAGRTKAEEAAAAIATATDDITVPG